MMPHRDPEERQKYLQKYYATPGKREATRARAKQWYGGNKSRARAAQKKYAQENREKVRAAVRKWAKANPEAKMLAMAKSRAKKRGLAFDLTREDIIIPAVCPVLGIAITGADVDHVPSIDRIDNAKGYVRGNIVVVSYRANRLKNDATPEELRLIADFYGGLISPRRALDLGHPPGFAAHAASFSTSSARLGEISPP